jgi:tetratricopeptide (TPR) repeat protein
MAFYERFANLLRPAALTVALTLPATSGWADLAAARKALDAKEYAKAFRDAASDTATRPAEAHWLRGKASMGLGKAEADKKAAQQHFEIAIGEFQRALSYQASKPTESRQLIIEVGEALKAAGEPEQAALHMARALEMQPQDFGTLTAYLDLLRELKRPEKIHRRGHRKPQQHHRAQAAPRSLRASERSSQGAQGVERSRRRAGILLPRHFAHSRSTLGTGPLAPPSGPASRSRSDLGKRQRGPRLKR